MRQSLFDGEENEASRTLALQLQRSAMLANIMACTALLLALVALLVAVM